MTSTPNSSKRAREDDPDAGADDAADTKAVFVTNREADFNENTFWMIDFDNYSGNQGATILVKRCMRNYGWNLEKAKTILKAYRQFLSLKKDFGDWDAKLLSPSHLVDQMWRQHILDIGNYCHDMMMLCGRVVLHNADGALEIQAKKTRDEKIRSELLKKFGSENVDRAIWDFPEEKKRTMFGDCSRAANPIPADITICIKDKANGEAFFKMNRNHSMGAVFQLYAERKGIEKKYIRFVRNGDRIADSSTPDSLGLTDMDQLDAVLDQRG
ncbi:unnamed protein product [Cylindrotheca closterium]|uniref:Ubiquitin-like domain-containing protein n=1 Tax=Cylindrotheca closterium TaxID=2856 RepID=A0AAD2G3B8_9STRA|nr:unnamed protein product [Cylindrotheca closterium]